MIDKEKLYGQNNRSWERHQALQEQITRKALDLPEDMNQNIRTGLGWKELLVIGAMIVGGVYFATREPAAAPSEDRDTTRRIAIEKYIPGE